MNTQKLIKAKHVEDLDHADLDLTNLIHDSITIFLNFKLKATNNFLVG